MTATLTWWPELNILDAATRAGPKPGFAPCFLLARTYCSADITPAGSRRSSSNKPSSLATEPMRPSLKTCCGACVAASPHPPAARPLHK